MRWISISHMLAAKDLIENIDDPEVKANADKLFSIREQRAIAFRQISIQKND